MMPGVLEEPVSISASETGTDSSSHEGLCDGHSKTQRSARGEWSLLSRQVSDPELGWNIKLYTHVAPPKARRLH